MTGRLRIFFDGGCRPNPGRMEIAAVARGVAHVCRDIGHGDSHEAEWLALLHAAGLAIELAAMHVEFVGDASAIIHVASGAWRAKGADVDRLAAFRAATAPLARVRLRHVPRSRNLAGIALAKGHPR